MRQVLVLGAVLLGLVAMAIGCGQTSSPHALIGPAGGSLEGSGVVVVVPEGALDHDVSISVTVDDVMPAGVDVAGSVYRFEPSGLHFAVPITVSLPNGAPGRSVFWTEDGVTNAFESLPTSVEGSVATAHPTHFSHGCVGRHGTNPHHDGGSDAGRADAATADASDAGRGDAATTTCDGGPCPPTTLAASSRVYDMATDGTNVYWTDLNAGTLMKCAVDGCSGAPTTLATNPDQSPATGLAIDAARVYWASGATGSVMSCPLAGCGAGPATVAGGQTGAFGVAVNGGTVFWSILGEAGTLRKATPTGLVSTVLNPASTGFIAADATSFYWAGWNVYGLWKVDHDGTHPVTFSTEVVFRPVVDATYVYWTEHSPADPSPTAVGSIYRANKNGTGKVALVTGYPAATALAVDGADVYFAITNGTAFAGQPSIAKCAIAGCGNVPTVIATGQKGPWAIAVDSKNVYWGNEDDAVNTIMKVAK